VNFERIELASELRRVAGLLVENQKLVIVRDGAAVEVTREVVLAWLDIFERIQVLRKEDKP
jgi:hypothetical protein